jgi:acetylglutamate kinase
MERVGKEVEFQDGFRVTDADTIDLVRMVLVGKVNRDIVSTVNVHGALAVGLSGEDANLISATARSEALGFVGDVVGVDPTIVLQLLAQGLIPVVATIGTDASGQAFNINADTAAGAIAGALTATRLFLLTDVAGVLDKNKTLIPELSLEQARMLMADGTASGGMIPKIETCVAAVEQGVEAAVILDGREPHGLLLEIFTEGGAGTLIRRD